MPSWDPKKLDEHYKKRITVDKGCFEDVLKLVGVMSRIEYETRSQDVVAKGWGEYEARRFRWESREINGYEEKRASYVDIDFITSVTDLSRGRFFTCFHEHFDYQKHGKAPKTGGTPGRRILRYREWFKNEEACKKFIDVRKIRGL